MKLVVGLVGLSVAVMTVLIYQALRQEFRLHNLRTRTMENAEAVKRREGAIVEAKKKILSLKSELDDANAKMDQLRKKKEEVEKSTNEYEEGLKNCNMAKEEAEHKKKAVSETIVHLKSTHEEAKKKADENIQNLKQQIMEKDKAVCAFVDATKEEARKLCGITAAK